MIHRKKSTLAQVYEHCKVYGLPASITMADFFAITEDHVLRRFVVKDFRKWSRVILGIKMTYPDAFSWDEGTDLAPSNLVVTETPPISDALKALKEGLSASEQTEAESDNEKNDG